MQRALVVSLHDVSPQTWEPCRRILAALHGLGVSSASLLVIPDHHHRGHFAKDAAFCEWLRARVGGGDEAVIHGYYHQRKPRSGESIADRIVTRSYTAGEGEFFDISYDEARALVAKARDEFHATGLHPTGFIAPAWLLSAEGERAIGSLGIRYTTRLRTVTDLHRLETKSQSLCWSIRAGWRRATSHVWNAFLFHWLENEALMRIAIHPVDIAHPRIWRQITRIIAAALATRKAMTYAQWIVADD